MILKKDDDLKEMENIYKGILIKMLKHPEKWTIFNKNSKQYDSPHVDKIKRIRFRTLSANRLGNNCFTSILLCNNYNEGEHCIYNFKFSKWDFKTIRLIKNLFNYFEKKDELEKIEQLTDSVNKANEEKFNILKNSLGPEYERFIKITKIKKKL